ncbi:hypothetical protein JHK87_052243 [Glycine soja]|nr:hypothetical protein JHK87_052243 [Glycine soja]
MNKIEQEKQVRGWITTNYRPWGIESRVKHVDESHFEANHSDPDDNLNALLKEKKIRVVMEKFIKEDVPRIVDEFEKLIEAILIAQLTLEVIIL